MVMKLGDVLRQQEIKVTTNNQLLGDELGEESVKC